MVMVINQAILSGFSDHGCVSFLNIMFIFDLEALVEEVCGSEGLIEGATVLGVSGDCCRLLLTG
jgi:hypothetical protein